MTISCAISNIKARHATNVLLFLGIMCLSLSAAAIAQSPAPDSPVPDPKEAREIGHITKSIGNGHYRVSVFCVSNLKFAVSAMKGGDSSPSISIVQVYEPRLGQILPAQC